MGVGGVPNAKARVWVAYRPSFGIGCVVAAEGASGLQGAGHSSALWMLHARVGMQEGDQVSAVGTSARNIHPVRALGHVIV